MAVIENARDCYTSQRENIEAWMTGGVATLMFSDLCRDLNVNVHSVRAYIRGK